MSDTVFLLHGLGPQLITGWSLEPLRLYLKYYHGFSNVHTIRYPVNSAEVDEMVDVVDAEMAKHASKDESVILIGQSMGGIVANRMHTKGWNVEKAIYIGSPMHGARLLGFLDAQLPAALRDVLYKKAYGFLLQKDRDESPPHDCHTISMSWPFTDFDGCVFRDETVLDEDKHTHLAWADHRTIFLNPRLWWHVGNILELETSRRVVE